MKIKYEERRYNPETDKYEVATTKSQIIEPSGHFQVIGAIHGICLEQWNEGSMELTVWSNWPPIAGKTNER